MYRRNISNVLYPIVAGLGLVIVYQPIVKPTYISPPTASHRERDLLKRKHGLQNRCWNQRSRTLTPLLPNNCESSMRPPCRSPNTGDRWKPSCEEIEKGNLKEAEASSSTFPLR